MKSLRDLTPAVFFLVGTLIGLAQANAATAEHELRKAHDSWFSGILNEGTPFLERFLAEDITLGFGARLMPRNDYLKHFSPLKT